MSTVYRHYQVHFKTPEGVEILSGLQIGIFNIITGAEVTIYEDQGSTALTNVITSTVFDALGHGTIDFWTTETSVDLQVIDVITRKAVYFRGLTTVDGHIIFDKKMNGLDAVAAVSAVQYTIPMIGTGLTASLVTMADASNDSITVAEMNIITGGVDTTADLPDFGTATVGRVTAMVNHSAVTLTVNAGTADNDINGIVACIITLYPEGWVALAEVANDMVVVIGGQGYSLAAA